MTKSTLVSFIRQQNSFLCVGLDADLPKLPRCLLDYPDPIFEFNKRIIDATKDYCVAYKPNVAFYEALGTGGWEALAKTLDYIPQTHFTIADAKRGDIGNTSRLYARTFFQTFTFDAITVAPYMGMDSVTPFLEFDGKWVIILGLTSNPGSADFQFTKDQNGVRLFEKVLERAASWGTTDNTMFVVGATQASAFQDIRRIIPDHFLLVPGVGSQGGSLEKVCEFGKNKDVGLLINSSRGIIYAGGHDENFSEGVRAAAQAIQQSMSTMLV